MFDLRNLPLITFEPDYIMKTYTRNEEYFKRYDSLGGAPIYWPKHTCSTCSAPIRSEFDGPAGECYDCGHQGRDLSPISSIHSVAAYFPKKYWGDAEGHIINQLIKFGRELFDAKDREYTEKMGNLLHLGIINGGYTSYDVSVIPPSSSDGPNHMTPKAEFVEDKTDISFEDPIVEVENTGESKKKGAQKRWEDSKDNYRCETSYEGVTCVDSRRYRHYLLHGLRCC